MRGVRHLGRFVTLWLLLWWYALGYALGRLRTLLIRDAEAKRAAVASLRGRILRRAVARLGATFVKLGQILSTRPDLLEPETIDELRALQDRLPAFPMPVVRRVVEEQLGGRLEDHFCEFDPVPVAAASVAQVHRARLPSSEEVAVKVLRPDIRYKVERDATVLVAFAKMIAWHPRWRLSDPVGHLRHFVAGILEQTDLRLEIKNYHRFRRHFADTPGVRFPLVYSELSGERVMTMQFCRGAKLDSLPAGDHRALAQRLQRAILKMCFVDGFIHADLHPGNLLLAPSGDLTIFDVGLVKQLSDDILVQFMDFAKCIAMGTPRDFVNHLQRFHTYARGVDWTKLEGALGKFIVRFRAQSMAELELGALMNEVFALARRFRVRPLPDMALVIVALVTAEGIGKQLDPGTNLFQDTATFLAPLLAQRGLKLAAGAG
jgi:ubiquinone biosynthesis protein